MNYSKLQNTAFKLLSKFGEDIIIRRETKTTYNPATNTDSVSTTDNYTVKGVKSNFRKSEIDGEIIQQGDFKLLLESKNLSIDPKTSDKIIYNSNIYKIIDIISVKPADTIIYYILQVRI